MHHHTVFCKWFNVFTTFPVLFCGGQRSPKLEIWDSQVDSQEQMVWELSELLYSRKDEVVFLVLSKPF